MFARLTYVFTLACALTAFSTLPAEEKKTEEKKTEEHQAMEHKTMEQTVCPISGKAINKENYADHNGKRVYFCCANCPKKFEQSADAIIEKMEKDGITLASAQKVQTACPVSGEEINKKIYADYESQRVYFCCPKCVDKFKSDAKAYIEKMKKDGITLEMVSK